MPCTILAMSNAFIIILICALLCLLLVGLSVIEQKSNPRFKFTPIMELWTSLLFLHGMIMLSMSQETPLVSIMMLGWLWPLRALWRYLGSLHTKLPVEAFTFQALGLGLALALVNFNYPFVSYMAPFFLGFGITTAIFLWKSYYPEAASVVKVVFGAIALFTIAQMAVPFWNFSGAFQLTLLLFHTCTLMLLAASTMMVTLLEQIIHRVHNIEDHELLGKARFFELGMMSAGIAHEINNPLTIIQTRTTQLLRIYRHPDQQKELAKGLQQILYTSERIERTVKGIREFFYQNEQVPFDSLTLTKVIDNVLRFCGQRLKSHSIELRFLNLDDVHLLGHEVQLEQVFLNLINNSLDAIDELEEKWIEVSVIKHYDYVEIFFKDSGDGIPAEVASHMMEPFYSTKGNKGTGLGLSLVLAILKKHEGSITYVPNSTHTTFLIELPLDMGDEAEVRFEMLEVQ